MMTLDEIYEEFGQLEDWEEQCEFLMELGRELPAYPAEERDEAHRVHGCQSQVWMTARPSRRDDGATTFEVLADSDSMFVRGLISVVLAAYSGRSAEEILATDIGAVFHRLGLDRHLTSQRRNGLFGMVQRVRGWAEQAQGA